MNRRIRPRTAAATVTASALAALLAACGSDPAQAGDQTSVDAGADQQAFTSALAEMDPVELKIQVLTPKESAHAKATEAYADAIEEWSGQKITFKIHYSGSIAATDVESAVADGLIDIAPVYPSMAPDTFPVQGFASNFTFVNDNTPVVGTLQTISAWTELGFDEHIVTEMQEQGLQPLLPMVVPSSNALYCTGDPTTSLATAKGTSMRTGTPGNAAEVKAIGASSVNLPTLEVFEGLQRRTVDCVVTGWAVPMSFGLAEVTDAWMLDPSVQFTGSSETLAIGKDTWDELPLAARQLMWDRLDVYLTSYVDNNMFATMKGALAQAEEHGVALHEYDDDLTKSLTDHQDGKLRDAAEGAPEGFDGTAFVERTTKTHEKWKKAITDLGYDDELTWEEFRDGEAGEVDVQPVVDALVEDVLATHRPTTD